jgi:pimeloyl-ACP methyl ester carboxylesterase
LVKGSWTPDYPFVLTHDQYDIWLRRLIKDWGGPAEIGTFAPSFVGDRQVETWWAGLLRTASSPGTMTAVLEALRDTDVRSPLPRIRTPTLVLHRRGDRAVRIEAGRHLATRSPDRGLSRSTATTIGSGPASPGTDTQFPEPAAGGCQKRPQAMTAVGPPHGKRRRVKRARLL